MAPQTRQLSAKLKIGQSKPMAGILKCSQSRTAYTGSPASWPRHPRTPGEPVQPKPVVQIAQDSRHHDTPRQSSGGDRGPLEPQTATPRCRPPPPPTASQTTRTCPWPIPNRAPSFRLVSKPKMIGHSQIGGDSCAPSHPRNAQPPKNPMLGPQIEPTPAHGNRRGTRDSANEGPAADRDLQRCWSSLAHLMQWGV